MLHSLLVQPLIKPWGPKLALRESQKELAGRRWCLWPRRVQRTGILPYLGSFNHSNSRWGKTSPKTSPRKAPRPWQGVPATRAVWHPWQLFFITNHPKKPSPFPSPLRAGLGLALGHP